MTPTLMQITESGWKHPDGTVVWGERHHYPCDSSNRTRILARDADHPTGPDGWKVVPQPLTMQDPRPGYTGTLQYMIRIHWEDIRFFGEAE